MTGAVFDPGLQPERTHLAWRRTALSVALGSIVALRIRPGVFHAAIWYVPGVLGVAVAAWLWWVSARRYRHVNDHLVEGRRPHGPGAAALLATTVFTMAVGALGVLTVAARGAYG